jgi:hypothetical protein
MSPVDSILGLPGVQVQRVERRRNIHVWVKPTDRPPCLHCSSNSLRIKATYERTLKHTSQANQVMVLHLSVPKYLGCLLQDVVLGVGQAHGDRVVGRATRERALNLHLDRIAGAWRSQSGFAERRIQSKARPSCRLA